MEDIDKFVNSAYHYDGGGGGCCSIIEWFDDNAGVGRGKNWDYNFGNGRDDSNGKWDSEGYGEGFRFGGHVSSKTHEITAYCYVNTENLYGKHR